MTNNHRSLQQDKCFIKEAKVNSDLRPTPIKMISKLTYLTNIYLAKTWMNYRMFTEWKCQHKKRSYSHLVPPRASKLTAYHCQTSSTPQLERIKQNRTLKKHCIHHNKRLTFYNNKPHSESKSPFNDSSRENNPSQFSQSHSITLIWPLTSHKRLNKTYYFTCHPLMLINSFHSLKSTSQ